VVQRLIIIAVTLVCGFAGGQSAAQDARPQAIGAVSRIQGEAIGTNGTARRPLGLNSSVFLNDVVSTGDAARLEVTFTDNTRLTLGETAKLTLDSYVFDSAAGSGTIKFGLVGAFRFVSGQVSKFASADVRVTTPVAIVGIRGTEFWGRSTIRCSAYSSSKARSACRMRRASSFSTCPARAPISPRLAPRPDRSPSGRRTRSAAP
jgi:hypothetical protein